MQSIACKSMWESIISVSKTQRETARTPETCGGFIAKTALCAVAFNGRNHAPQRRDVDAAHV